MATKLRFAPLIRVSTEGQEKKGESLRTQRTQIVRYVETLGGTIPEYCWRYSGQEHATPGHDRKNLDQLLQDSGKKLFDAVIVSDLSRWSRDNFQGKQSLEILKKNGIRFFIGPTESDLYNPEQNMFLGLTTEINEFHARNQSLKSIQNRIERAKRGIPTSGKLPYGRTFDRRTEEWGVDKDKAESIRWAADQYLNHGKGIEELGRTLGMNFSNLWKILTRRAGDTWKVVFDCDKVNIHETIEIKIPSLLSQDTIKAIHLQAAANKTYTHGEIKNKYLLSRMIFCEKCGNAMFGQTNHRQRRYYRHPRHRVNKCDPSIWIPADGIEKAVLVHLFKMYGDVSAMEKAIQRAIPDRKKVEQMRKHKLELELQITTVHTQQKRLIDAIANGIISQEEADIKLRALRERNSLLEQEKINITQQLEHLPSRERTEMAAKTFQYAVRRVFKRPEQLLKMKYEQQRELVQMAFSGKDHQGKRTGVYVRKHQDSRKQWSFVIRGMIATIEGTFPLTKRDVIDSLEIDVDYINQQTEELITNFTCYSPGPGPPGSRWPSRILPHPA